MSINVNETVQERFLSFSFIMKVIVYSIALRQEKYELLAEIDKVANDEVRESVKRLEPFLESWDDILSTI
jgi:hypothetical protein